MNNSNDRHKWSNKIQIQQHFEIMRTFSNSIHYIIFCVFSSITKFSEFWEKKPAKETFIKITR